jgi:peroxiredoxin
MMTKMRKKLDVLGEAPDFELKDTLGNTVRLSDFRNKKPVVLVITRGFM